MKKSSEFSYSTSKISGYGTICNEIYDYSLLNFATDLVYAQSFLNFEDNKLFSLDFQIILWVEHFLNCYKLKITS